ncbi:MAG: tRNA pseudouridine(38-40) synthase TruA [Clostridiales bacterium]|nr:tRNA pseudouridine(38-40) synthase TruA [Clostridiales bacterium]
MKILLQLSYDGSAFHGWQVQKNAVTVQETLQDAIQALTGERLPVTGCSRTDAGVHARVFYCTVPEQGLSHIALSKLPSALNAHLPTSVAIEASSMVDDEFHPRYSCKQKEYLYDIYTGPYRDPFCIGRSWQLCKKLDTDRMNKAGRILCGTHDFSSFCAASSSVEDKVRTVSELQISDGLHVMMRISADGFLYNMVRIIMGTLVQVGMGKMPPESVKTILEGKDRALAGATAPACGLYLNRVIY